MVNRKLLVIGNGGSGATAQFVGNTWVKTRHFLNTLLLVVVVVQVVQLVT
jgi:ABC-type methionine transport system permease subunit